MLADPEVGTLDGIINADDYPLEDLEAARTLGDQVALTLAKEGAVTLPGFLASAPLSAVTGDLDHARNHVTIRRHRGTVYSRPELESQLDVDDPRLVELEWHAGHVTRDMIPSYSIAHRLYVAPAFKRFVAACVGLDRVFEYADPLAGLVATVLPPGGGCYPWHYDTNEFVVTIMIRKPRAGGSFVYRKDLRSPGDENLAGLARILDGSDTEDLRTTNARPGDLQLFRGRYSLHRVTPVEGPDARVVLVLSYADRPGVIGPLDRTRSVYGRVTEAHLMAAHAAGAADGLIL